MPQYALVAYLRNPVGEFVEALRRELHPAHGHLPAHITVLPPRTLGGTEPHALEFLEQACSAVAPFEVSLGDVETFCPTTPTVFIRVAFAAYRMRELHDRLNQGLLWSEEQFPYMPHLTIAKLGDPQEALALKDVAAQHWARFKGNRRVLLEELTFVREGPREHWMDLAPIPLGKRLAEAQR